MTIVHDDEKHAAAHRARAFYDDPALERYCFEIYGSDHIHVGIYEAPDDTIAIAVRRSVVHMASLLDGGWSGARVLDVGSGYGGAARFLASERGCRVDCLNVSPAQNEHNRRLVAALGLSGLVRVVDGDFEEMPFADGSYDVVWSADALVHGDDRPRALREIDRVLCPGGSVVFSDVMCGGALPDAIRGPLLDRVHLASMGSFEQYRAAAADLGWREVIVHDMSPSIARHYAAVLGELDARRDELSRACSGGFVDRMRRGLEVWVEAGRAGLLTWGMFHFQKPSYDGAASGPKPRAPAEA